MQHVQLSNERNDISISFKAHEYMLYVAQEGMHASQFMYVVCSMCVSMRIYM